MSTNNTITIDYVTFVWDTKTVSEAFPSVKVNFGVPEAGLVLEKANWLASRSVSAANMASNSVQSDGSGSMPFSVKMSARYSRTSPVRGRGWGMAWMVPLNLQPSANNTW